MRLNSYKLETNFTRHSLIIRFSRIWRTSMSSRTKNVSLAVTFLITFILCIVRICRLFYQHLFSCLDVFSLKKKKPSNQSPCWADCQENTTPSISATRGINKLKKLLKLMVLLVYPLKDSLPNSSAILSYKLKMQQFSCPFYHHVKRPFKRP